MWHSGDFSGLHINLRCKIINSVASSRAGALNAFVDQPGEEAGVDDELPPFRIECRGRPGRDRLVTRPPLFFQRRDVVPDGNQHVAEFPELGLVADRLAVTWNDDGIVCRRRQIGVGRGDHSVDAAAGRIIDERINTVPESVPYVNDIGLGEGDGNVAVGMFLIFGWRKLRDYSGTVSQMVQEEGLRMPMLATAVSIFRELPVAFAVAVGAFTRPCWRHGPRSSDRLSVTADQTRLLPSFQPATGPHPVPAPL